MAYPGDTSRVGDAELADLGRSQPARLFQQAANAMDRAVFVDRDNTLIANDGDLGDPSAVRLLAGVPEGIKTLRRAGYRIVVVTNQGGVARGAFTEADVERVHQRIADLLSEDGASMVDRFYFCPFHPEGSVSRYRREHPWRKPSPGMLLQAAADLDLDLKSSWLIGDQARDVESGRAAGCRTVRLCAGGTDQSDSAASSFGDAVAIVLAHPGGPDGPQAGSTGTSASSPAS